MLLSRNGQKRSHNPRSCCIYPSIYPSIQQSIHSPTHTSIHSFFNVNNVWVYPIFSGNALNPACLVIKDGGENLSNFAALGVPVNHYCFVDGPQRVPKFIYYNPETWNQIAKGRKLGAFWRLTLQFTELAHLLVLTAASPPLTYSILLSDLSPSISCSPPLCYGINIKYSYLLLTFIV